MTNAQSAPFGTTVLGNPRRVSDQTTKWYRVVWDGTKHISEHRLIMQRHLGRILRSDELVHHKDGNRLNNDISNLEVLAAKPHSRHHNLKYDITRKCVICGNTFDRDMDCGQKQKTCGTECGIKLAATSRTRLTRDDILLIQARVRSGERVRHIMKENGMDVSSFYYAKKRWNL